MKWSKEPQKNREYQRLVSSFTVFLAFSPNKAGPCGPYIKKPCLATLGCQDQPHSTAMLSTARQNTRSCSYTSDSYRSGRAVFLIRLKESVHKNHLFGTRSTVISMYIYNSPENNRLIRILGSRIGVHRSRCLFLIHFKEPVHKNHLRFARRWSRRMCSFGNRTTDRAVDSVHQAGCQKPNPRKIIRFCYLKPESETVLGSQPFFWKQININLYNGYTKQSWQYA